MTPLLSDVAKVRSIRPRSTASLTLFHSVFASRIKLYCIKYTLKVERYILDSLTCLFRLNHMKGVLVA